MYSYATSNSLSQSSTNLTPDQLISKMVTNGPINNNYDAFVIYTLEEINQIYATTYANQLIPLQPFTMNYNVTNATDASIQPPIYWYYYSIVMSFTNPVLSFNEEGLVVLSQTISPGSYYNQTTCYGPPLINTTQTSVEKVYFNNATFTLTCPLAKMQSIVEGGLIALNLTNSTLEINEPNLPSQFATDFADYWKDGKDEIYTLGKITDAGKVYNSLVPYDFDVCTIPKQLNDENAYVVIVINTQASNQTVQLNVSCYELFPASLYETMIPQGYGVSLYLSTRNMASFLQDTLADTVNVNEVKINEQTGQMLNMTANSTLYNVQYIDNSQCKVDSTSTMNGEYYNCGYSSKKTVTNGAKPSFLKDNSKEGTPSYVWQLQAEHDDVASCAQWGSNPLANVKCGCCYGQNGPHDVCVKPQYFSGLDLELNMNAFDADLNITLNYNHTYTSAVQACDSYSVTASPINRTGVFTSAITNVDQASHTISETLSVFRLSNILFPECHVM
eukprot:Pgem_evm1s10728